MSFSGIKMGRIPKAEKMKAIENLKNTCDQPKIDDLEQDDEQEEETQTSSSSYNKRFEIRKELENNLAFLASNILKMISTTTQSQTPKKPKSAPTITLNHSTIPKRSQAI